MPKLKLSPSIQKVCNCLLILSEWRANQEEAEVLGGGEGRLRLRGRDEQPVSGAVAALQESHAVEGEAAEALAAAAEPVVDERRRSHRCCGSLGRRWPQRG